MTNELNTFEASEIDIIPAAVTNLIDRYNTFLSKTIENILELGKVVYEVDQNLTDADRYTFCSQTNLKDGESTYRKLKQIGKNYEMLSPHKDCLPNNWTTVYQLTRLKKEAFESLIEKNILNPYVTMKEISSQLNKKEKGDPKHKTLKFTLTLSEKDKIKIFQLEQEIRLLANRFGVELKFNKKQYDQLNETQSTMQEAA